MATQQHHQVLIIGGGAAGITVAAELRKDPEGSQLDIAIVEPSDSHYYQPALTLVGAGTYSLSDTRRSQLWGLPASAGWFFEASEFPGKPTLEPLLNAEPMTLERFFASHH